MGALAGGEWRKVCFMYDITSLTALSRAPVFTRRASPSPYRLLPGFKDFGSSFESLVGGEGLGEAIGKQPPIAASTAPVREGVEALLPEALLEAVATASAMAKSVMPWPTLPDPLRREKKKARGEAKKAKAAEKRAEEKRVKEARRCAAAKVQACWVGHATRRVVHRRGAVREARGAREAGRGARGSLAERRRRVGAKHQGAAERMAVQLFVAHVTTSKTVPVFARLEERVGDVLAREAARLGFPTALQRGFGAHFDPSATLAACGVQGGASLSAVRGAPGGGDGGGGSDDEDEEEGNAPPSAGTVRAQAVLDAAPDAYAVLAISGLPITSSSNEAELKRAYHKLASVIHPDKLTDFPRATEAFQALEGAYRHALEAMHDREEDSGDDSFVDNRSERDMSVHGSPDLSEEEEELSEDGDDEYRPEDEDDDDDDDDEEDEGDEGDDDEEDQGDEGDKGDEGDEGEGDEGDDDDEGEEGDGGDGDDGGGSEHETEAPADGDAKPKTDKAAIELLVQLASDRFVAVDGGGKERSVWTWEHSTGLWSGCIDAFHALCMQHADQLGKYGTMKARMDAIYKLVGAVKRVGPTWTRDLNQLGRGLVPFADGLYNIATGALDTFTPEHMLTVKLSIDAPTAGEVYANETQVVRQCVTELFPEPALRSELLKRYASSFFIGDPMVGKYFIQVTGEGDNGKTTFQNILQAAFPEWVKTPEIDKLLMHGSRSDANAAQPWKMTVMGARLLFFEEAPADAIFDGKLLTKLRGGGFVTGRNLYENDVTYRPTYRISWGGNTPVEIKPLEPAVLRSIHAFEMPSTFVSAGDARLGPPAQPLHFAMIEQLDRRFEQRPYKIALFRLLVDYYQEYENDGLDSQQTLYDRRSLYTEADEARTEHDVFYAHFEVLAADDGITRLGTREIHSTLKNEGGYQHSERHLANWLLQHFKVNRSANTYGHASVRQVKSNGAYKWVCIIRKATAGSDSEA